MAAGDTYELAIKGLVQGQQIVTTHYFRAEAAGDLTALIATDWVTDCKALYRTMQPTDYTMTELFCRQINPPGPAGADLALVAPNGGNAANASGALNAAAVITWTTAYVGRSRRGRSFIGPLQQGGALLGSLAAVEVTNKTNYAAQMLASFGSGGTRAADCRFVIWSHKIAGSFGQNPPPAMGSPTSASAYVQGFRVNTIVRSQRRRELGVGG